MTYEQLPDEWKEWLDLTPLERFRRSEEIFAQYLAMGGSLECLNKTCTEDQERKKREES